IVIRSKGKLLWGYGPANTTDDRVGFVRVAQRLDAQMQLSRNTLYMQTSARGTKTLKIFDMLGNQLLAQSFEGSQAWVNLENLRRGVLVARLVAGNKLLASKVIRVK
ncbi:MAG: T9SS type A sorting domain-containing protein, partial [Fibrobacter sp.]|nr:T9SS type A sorting domain-containing protein [Fibrobacter sp.]